MLTHVEKQLCESAITVRKNAYAPYSKFKVGVAILDELKNILSKSPGCKVVDDQIDGGYITPVDAEGDHKTFISVSYTHLTLPTKRIV